MIELMAVDHTHLAYDILCATLNPAEPYRIQEVGGGVDGSEATAYLLMGAELELSLDRVEVAMRREEFHPQHRLQPRGDPSICCAQPFHLATIC